MPHEGEGRLKLTVSASGSGFVDRVIRAAKVDSDLFVEVEHDQSATGQAAIVVVGTSIAAGIGSAFTGSAASIIVLPIAAIVSWAVFAWLTYFIGTRLLAGPETKADWGELARTLGFANTPRALLLFGVVPVAAAILGVIVAVWVLITTVVAVRAALDFSTGRAIATVILGWLVQVAIIAVAIGLLA